MIDAIDIDELSTAEFSYKGIATVYKNDNRTDIKCRVCYSAVVKAGINMHDVRFDVDEDNKTITAILPEIELRVYINDEEPMALLPSDANVEIDILRKCSKEDAETEARNSTDLLDAAQTNLRSTIEGLLFPITKSQGYTLVWN